jgi:hypothetical protein
MLCSPVSSSLRLARKLQSPTPPHFSPFFRQ